VQPGGKSHPNTDLAKVASLLNARGARVAVTIVWFDPDHAPTALTFLPDRDALHVMVEINIIFTLDFIKPKVVVVV
jgi:hypothetical protein